MSKCHIVGNLVSPLNYDLAHMMLLYVVFGLYAAFNNSPVKSPWSLGQKTFTSTMFIRNCPTSNQIMFDISCELSASKYRCTKTSA